MTSVEDKLRCPFCLEEITYLENPKQLDCGHIYCQPCLEGHVTTADTGVVLISCVICSQEYKLASLDGLITAHGATTKSSSTPATPCDGGEPDSKRARIQTSTSNSEPRIDDKYRCTPCGEKRVKSVCYCASCDKQLCENHQQMHNEVFSGDEKHQTMDIEQYMEKPKLYVKPLCENHQKELSMCCIDCYSMKCVDCHRRNTCTGSNSLHTYVSLQEVGAQIKAQFASICKEVAGKITEMCKTEKDAWHKLDQLEDECEIMYNQVETKTEVLIKLVQEFASSTKHRIKSYEIHSKLEVERKLQELRSDREKAESLQTISGDTLNNMHDLEIVQRRQGLQFILRAEISKYSVFDGFPEMSLMRDLYAGFMAVEGSLKVDHKLSFVTDVSLPKKSRCNMVARSIGYEQPLILCACKEGIIFQTASDLVAKKWRRMATDGEVLSVLCWNRDLYYIEADGRNGKHDVHYVKCVHNFLNVATDLKEKYEQPEELLRLDRNNRVDDFITPARMMIKQFEEDKLEIDIGSTHVTLNLRTYSTQFSSNGENKVYDVGAIPTKGNIYVNRGGLSCRGANIGGVLSSGYGGSRAIAIDNQEYFLVVYPSRKIPILPSRIYAISWKDGKELRCLEMLEFCDPVDGVCMFGRDVYMMSKDGVRLMKFLLPEIDVDKTSLKHFQTYGLL